MSNRRRNESGDDDPQLGRDHDFHSEGDDVAQDGFGEDEDYPDMAAATDSYRPSVDSYRSSGDPLDAELPPWADPAPVVPERMDEGESGSLESAQPFSDAEAGNYIITIGPPGSGKSTLQSHLLRFLFKEGRYACLPDRAQADEEWERTIELWRAYWRSNMFPPRTARGRMAALRYTIRPTSPKGLPSLRFGMLEISGEELRVVHDRRLAPRPKLPPAIRGLLANPDSSVIFLFVANGADVRDNDEYFSGMIDLILTDETLRHRASCKVALVISDPVKARENLMTAGKKTLEPYLARAGARPRIEQICSAEIFCEAFLKETTGKLEHWGGEKKAMYFEVGEVYKHKEHLYVKDPAFDDAEKLFRWAYQTFTKHHPDGNWVFRTLRGFLES